MRIKRRWIGFALLAAGLLACAVPLAQWVSQNNAEDAVWSAWGKRISVGEDGVLSLVE